MASKRKSTIPCMIPAKTVGVLDSHGSGPPNCSRLTFKGSGVSLPPEEVATTVRESREENNPSSPERDDLQRGVDSYGCQPCRFESRDLNLFLDHVYTSHPDFRAEPSFYCIDCGVTTRKFEGLALHNARTHPSTATTTLQVRKRDWRITVEQSVVPGGCSVESEISITKTPIMKMLKGKSETKRIVVSHIPDESGPANGNEAEAKELCAAMRLAPILNDTAVKKSTVSGVPIVNGGSVLPIMKVPVGQAVQNRTHFQQSTPAVVSSLSSSSDSSSKNLPKVLIPLCSIPTYDAAMDTSSFLKTSFSKFPYPTKAELCYLTVVTSYPEEQIKIWFTAQRLKQGISWSPEEIEDSRRKMFSTVIQPPSTVLASSRQPSQSHHRPVHNSHRSTITVLPAKPAPGGMTHILQANLKAKSGVIISQPTVSNGTHVGGGPNTLAVTPKPNTVAGPQMQVKPAAALVADKGAGIVVGVAGSSSGSLVISSGNRTSSIISSTVSSDYSTNSGSMISSNSTSAQASIISSTNTCKTNCNTSKISNSCVDGKVMDLSSLVPGGSHSSRMLPSSFLDPSFYKSKKSQQQLGALKQSFIRSQFPEQEEVERLTRITGLTVREIRKWFSDRRYHNRNLKGLRASEVGLLNKGCVLADGLSLAENTKTHQSSLSPPTLQQEQVSSLSNQHRLIQTPDCTTRHDKEREARQLSILEASFVLDPLPSLEELDRLQAKTKMTRQEIDGWFLEQHKKMVRKVEKAAMNNNVEENKGNKHENVTKREENSKAQDHCSGTPAQHTEVENVTENGPGTKPKVNPIKINLKMLKVTDPSAKKELDDGQAEREHHKTMSQSPSLSAVAPSRSKKTPEQMHMLKQLFARTQWPGSEQYDQLVALTGLPRSEVVRWFGDSRYVYKNGQLKWLEAYQRAMQEEEEEEEEEVVDEGESTTKDESQAPGDLPGFQGTEQLEIVQDCREKPSHPRFSTLSAEALQATKQTDEMSKEILSEQCQSSVSNEEAAVGTRTPSTRHNPCQTLSGAE